MQTINEENRIEELTSKELKASLESNIELLHSGKIEVVYLREEEIVLIPIYMYELYINTAKYHSNEIVSAQTFANDMQKLLVQVKTSKLEKLAIIYEDRLMVGVLRYEEYVQIKEVFEKQEAIDIAKVIEERVTHFKGKLVIYSMEDMEEYFKSRGV